MSKDLWFANFEDELNRLEDEGEADAYDRASENAFSITRDKLADKADTLRKASKESI